MKKNRGLFYFMHIPWTWAKQRPQFLAQELSREFTVQVAYKKPFSGKNQSKEESDIKLLPIGMLPFNAKSSIIRSLNKLITKSILKKQVSKMKFVWITSPDLFDLLPVISEDQIVIYDCMDDMLSFSAVKDHPHVYKYFKSAEERLVKRANLIICSSDNLKSKIIDRYAPEGCIEVINNGISENIFVPLAQKESGILTKKEGFTNVVYIGTIAKWMDWELILRSLESDANLVYHFVGPQETPVPENERIIAYGPVPHKEIKGIMNEADILFMPFEVNDLIMSVNPVKLYEYIYAGKPAISVRYGETLKFEKYVYLYNGLDEYLGTIEKIRSSTFGRLASKEDCELFCVNNTWKVRGNKVQALIENLEYTDGESFKI